jgi:cytochrome c-type biogenesis protein CcmF
MGYALVSYTLAGFVATTIGQEFVKGVGARRRMHGEAVPIALMRLIARNRRRYGGYIVHFGVGRTVRGVRGPRVQERV